MQHYHCNVLTTKLYVKLFDLVRWWVRRWCF